MGEPTRRSSWSPLVGALVVARIAILLVALHNVAHSAPIGDEDVHRFHQIAIAEGTPYRDFPVEYPPLEVVMIRAIGGASANATATHLVWVAFGLDLIVILALWYGWGKRAASAYLVLSLPVLGFLYLRLDLLSVALAMSGFALARRGRERVGGLALGAAVLAKVWPLVVLPALVISGRWKALRWTAGAVGAGATLWLWWGGLQGPIQVVTFRGAHGWEVESTVGVVVWILTGGPVRIESGAPRVGIVSSWSTGLLLLALIAGLTAMWSRARHGDPDRVGAPAVAAIATLLVLSPIFSLQYVIWLLPWAAVAVAEHRRSVAALTLAVSIMTGVLYILATQRVDASATWLLQSSVLIRNGLVTLLAVAWLLIRERRSSPPRPDTRVATRRSPGSWG